MRASDCLQAPHTADKKIVVLPDEITRNDVRIIMWNIMDIYGATPTEKSLITRSTVNMFGVINEVSTLLHLQSCELKIPLLHTHAQREHRLLQYYRCHVTKQYYCCHCCCARSART